MPDKKTRNIILIAMLAALVIECVWLFVIRPRQVSAVSRDGAGKTAASTVSSEGTGGPGVTELVSAPAAPEAAESESEAAAEEPAELFPMPDPTPTPVVTTAPNAASMKNVVTPITEKDLEGLTAEELRIKRNEIFARHGLIFGAEDLNAYFNAQPWYEGTVTDSESIELSDVEMANVQTILDYEEKMGYNQ